VAATVKRARALRWQAFAAPLLFALAGYAIAQAASEYQVKAVFVYNFSRFVDWPANAQGVPEQPFVIGVLGEDPFGGQLDDAVRNEQVNGHPLLVKRLHRLDEIGACQILFIASSEGAQLGHIVAALNHSATLTVSDLDRSAERGVMIQFMTENNRIRLRINAEAAHAAGLTINSNLLRAAEIVSTLGGG
jgi:hypothetical protein